MAIAIMTSGGDCAGMNPAIKCFVDYSFDKGLKPFFIYDGLEGLIDDNIQEATHKAVAGIIHMGGTIIHSSRSQRFFEYKYREQAYENLKKRGITKIIVLGGDGTFRAFNQFYTEFGINFVGVPSTIDNDIFGTEYCLGVDTALNVIREAIDDLRDTSSSFKRACVIETMGRDCGYLALISAIASGAEVCIIPEVEYNLESLGKRLKNEIENGRRYIIAVVAEGSKATQKIIKWLNEDVKIETRATILGHIQRGGNPTVHDRLMATEFISHAVDKLLYSDKSNFVVVYKDSKFSFVTIDYAISRKYELDSELIGISKKMFH